MIPDVSDLAVDQLWSLARRVAVVTGAGRGLGAAIARRLAQAGAVVLVADVDDAAAVETAESIGGTAAHVDVANAASVAALADWAVEHLGGLDIWVNNAGVFGATPLLDLSDEAWDRALDINLRGTFIGAREAARCMVAADGSGGVIVNIASVAGLGGRGPGVAHYVASKHGVVGLTKQLALELAPKGVRVLGVAPSQVRTPGVEQAWAARGLEPDIPIAPVGRAAVPDDVARVVLFCASDVSLFMTGTTLTVDGGELAR